ncbi:TIR domain-containing protein [Flavobacterium aquicola]|uniref:Putative nucleotide-binding protein with TIR-like domain n=1 Tax=Flavobacterium aquicola TaxID=1682742 RepID=A0A3E0E3M2_9FLAO|nr:TIR domain-containing protein [Flavobacterium aquicola]REG92250.1 putative nucleotide-binding protein with TIR-like domain [Flavobacterium aquicola]
MNQSNITVFYSWQSDLSKDTNQHGIKLSIKSAIPLIETDFENIDIVIDEATRNVSGSPDITKEIFRKISNSDIFICDLTPIGESLDKKKKLSNPNVLIELGYAIAELGWERIILLFNTNYGKIPDDLPFDVAKHRTTTFKIIDKSDKSGKNELTGVLTKAIKLIIRNSPLKPHQEKNVTPDEKKRNLDIDNLKKILSSIHIPTFDSFLEDAPELLIYNQLHYFEGFKAVLNSNLFYLYDQILLEKIKTVFTLLNKSLSYGQHYIFLNNAKTSKFVLPAFDQNDYDEAMEDYRMLIENINQLKVNFKDLISYIRENYIEIDLKETSKIAFEDYLSYQSEYEK